MTAYAELDLYPDTQCDYVQQVTLLGNGATALGLTVTAAVLTIRATYVDPLPLVQVSQASGGLVFGVAVPGPIGAQCANLAELEATGSPVVSTAPPVPIVLTVATVAALAAAATTGYLVGTLAFVQAGTGAYYMWSPGDTNTPNGTTVVASTGATAGNWLLYGTVNVTIPAAQLGPMVGVVQGAWDLLVTWSNGTTSKMLEGNVYCDQSVGGH